jgi:Na+/melibiose symporter-like transporter
MWNYGLTEERIKEIQAELAKRKANEPSGNSVENKVSG